MSLKDLMRLWHTILAFCLLLLVAAPLLFLSALQLRQWHIQHTLEERLDLGDWTVLRLCKNGVA